MEWLPQVEILAHPALKVGLTHGGFGGTLEFISFGVPVVIWPHFGDQNDNSTLLVEAGAGVELCRKKKHDTTIEAMSTYKTKVFEAVNVCEAF